MSETRCGFVAIIGIPNAGKSTLINRLVGSKIAIVTPKAQTTRQSIRGICQLGDSQLIFVDTPGIFAAQPKFERAMVGAAWKSVSEADAVLVLIDAGKGIDKEMIAQLAKTNKKHVFAALNKIDETPKAQLLEMTQSLLELYSFEQVFMISALTGDGVDDVKQALANAVPQGPWLYPDDQLTDSNLRDLSAELTREQCFLKLRQELPYSLMVETEQWEEQEGGKLKIAQTITVEREAHKKMLIGAGGQMLKSIGQGSRIGIQKLLNRGVHLQLFVRVREGWKDKPESFRTHHLEF